MRAFVAIATASQQSGGHISPVIERAKPMGLSVRHQTDRLAIFASEDMPVQWLNGTCGAIVGDIFRRGAPVGMLAGGRATRDEISKAVIGSRIQDEFWGDFVAIHLSDDGSLRFAHSPCGSVNLYYLACDGCLLIASNSAILLALAQRQKSLNWTAIAHNLVWDDMSSSMTCVDGVHEIRCGEVGHWKDNRISVETVWNPWSYTETEVSVSGPEEAIELVRYEILRSIGARREAGGQVAIDLSGGLDSSIIAAACTASGIDATCINLYDPDTEGDERQFARRVAEFLQLDLIEVSPSARDVDLGRCARAHLPRPYVRSFVQAVDHCAQQAASSLGATAFMNGGGGDSVFCHLQSSGPVVDAWKSGGRAPSAIQVASDVSRAAQCSFGRSQEGLVGRCCVGARPGELSRTKNSFFQNV